MDSDQFREFGKAAIDYIADYMDNIRERPVLPSVEPGYLRHLLPEEAPEKPEHWQDVLSDVERVIMPGITQWMSPNFHAYFPTGHSFPSIVGDIISNGIASIGINWFSSPACTELEVITLDWLGKMINLPREFLNCFPGAGGGVIQASASESSLLTLLAAKERTVVQVKKDHPDWDEGYIKSKLVSYGSDHANSSVEKTGLLASVPMRLLPVDEDLRLRGTTLMEAIKRDREDGLIPCYVVGTLGTTGTCAFDALDELGEICQKEKLWLHVDAAYAGTACICPEYQYLMNGVELADSFCVSPHKWMLVNSECCAVWLKDSSFLVEPFSVDHVYLKHDKQGVMPDFRHWQIPVGRRFRALKLWFVLRLYGVQGLQEHIRRQVKLAAEFESLVSSDPNFELATKTIMGLVCFRMKGENVLTERLLKRLTARKNIYMVAATVRNQYVIRFVITSRLTDGRDLQFAWEEIRSQAEVVLHSEDDSDLEQPAERVVTCKVNALVNGNKGHSDEVSPKKARREKETVENVSICISN